MSNKTNIKYKIEALLFAYGRPLPFSKMFRILGVKEDVIKKELETLRQEYKKKNRGIDILIRETTAEMVTNPSYGSVVSKLLNFDLEERLSDSTLETLSIISYRGPISKAEIERIRGINSAYPLRNLQVRGLIIKKKDESDARLYTFEVSEKFLKHMGITNVSELPDFDDLSKKTSFEDYLQKKEQEEQENIISSVNR